MKWFILAIVGLSTLLQLSGAEFCYWDGTSPNCLGSCPTGFTERERHQYGDGNRCWTGTKARCCMPTIGSTSCHWEGAAPFCSATCPSGYAEITRDRSGDGSNCWTGTKSLCCSINALSTIQNLLGSINP